MSAYAEIEAELDAEMLDEAADDVVAALEESAPDAQVEQDESPATEENA